ncbi:MAG: VOC family protein [Sphingobacteriales bacterium]|nr:MAG: VOC family protein [Sphingobacteriales bacterium]
MQKVFPNLWFNGNAEQAVNFYVNVFKNSSIGDKTYYTNEGQEYHKKEAGTVLTIEFSIEGQDFVALNAGPEFKFNEAISFVVNCDTQEEIDYYWNALSAHPESEQCGWLKDKFGVSWQITPPLLQKMIKDSDPDKVSRVMKAMFAMKKINIKELQQAYNGNA